MSTPMDPAVARAALDALLGKRVRAVEDRLGDVTIIEGTLFTEAGVYAARDALVRYPADVHVDHLNLISVEEVVGADLRDRIARELMRHHIDLGQVGADRADICVCGGWVSAPMSPGWDDHLAEVATEALARELEEQPSEARDVIRDLVDLVERIGKTSVTEIAPGLARRVMGILGCPECGEHPDTHCGSCQACPCECGEADREH